MKRILLVDDVPAVRLSIRAALEAAGYRIMEAADGKEALSLLDSQAVDLIVTDLWMPNLDGVELLKRLRASNADVRVIAISGGGMRKPIDVSAALAQTWGADAVLYKPFDNEDLVAEVRRLLPG
jgi:two-component system, chemotaxis family, chemotaxis protein CheY